MNYIESRNAYCNCEKRIFSGVGDYDIPEIIPQEFDLKDFEILGFNYVKGENFPKNKVVHFYLDDYQFDRVWKYPNVYIDMLKPFKAVLAPDFSLYTDFPRAVQIYNHYRKHWIARYWQEHGIKVIPTICWSDENSFEWCFDGEPKNAVISISVLGCNRNEQMKTDYWKGFNKAIEVLQPKTILLFKGSSSVKLPPLNAEVIEVTSGNIKGAEDYKDGVSKYNKENGDKRDGR